MHIPIHVLSGDMFSFAITSRRISYSVFQIWYIFTFFSNFFYFMEIISKIKLFVAIWVQVMETRPTAARMFKVYNLSRNFKKTIFFGSISEFGIFLKLKKLRKNPEKTRKNQKTSQKCVFFRFYTIRMFHMPSRPNVLSSAHSFRLTLVGEWG